MTIDAADRLRLQAIAPWLRKANAEITRRIGDARAHAERSLARSNASAKHLVTAQTRLEELQTCLVGTESSPHRGVIQDARAHCYAAAFRQSLPESIRDSAAIPTPFGERSARELKLWGLTPLAEMQAVFLPVQNSLRTSLALAKLSEPDSRESILDTWETRAIDRISQAIVGMLSNSEAAIFNLVGHSMVKPELRA